jgi:hypothetical protein
MNKIQFLTHKNACILEGSHLNQTSLINNLKTSTFKEKIERIKMS